MRIIGGSLRGRNITAPRGLRARPMRDSVRESLFGQLGEVEGERVLDLFSGSGSLGLEALSRGAEHVVFCEKARPCLAAIRKNLEELGLTSRASLSPVDLALGLKQIAVSFEAFELVLMDPPFPLLRRAPGPGEADVRLLLAELGQSEILTPDARICFETPARSFRVEMELSDWGLALESRREHGSTALWILSRDR